MILKDFERAALVRSNAVLTDEELDLLLNTAKCLVAYFHIREEPLIADSLRQELTSYEKIMKRRLEEIV